VGITGAFMSKKNISFEENLQNLEKIVADLESGKISLDDSIKKYEEGVKVFKSCKVMLSRAEKKIQILSDTLEEEDFE
jgi:exodeoxyribonuclease VII small subunit